MYFTYCVLCYNSLRASAYCGQTFHNSFFYSGNYLVKPDFLHTITKACMLLSTNAYSERKILGVSVSLSKHKMPFEQHCRREISYSNEREFIAHVSSTIFNFAFVLWKLWSGRWGFVSHMLWPQEDPPFSPDVIHKHTWGLTQPDACPDKLLDKLSSSSAQILLHFRGEESAISLFLFHSPPLSLSASIL